MAQEKIKFDTPDSPFPFMPPIAELLGWLGGPEGLHTPLHWMQQDLGLRKPDLKTLRKACQDGVTPRIAEMIKANIHEAAREKGFTEFLDQFTPTEPVVNGTNGTKWLSEARGFLEAINHHQPMELDLPQTFAFLKRRAEAESQLLQAFRHARTMDTSPEEKFAQMHTAFYETCRHHTLLSSDEILAYGTAMIDASRLGYPRTPSLVAEALKCLFSLRVDFYHQLLASFMADMLLIRETLKLPLSLDVALRNHGGMGQLMPVLEQDSLVTPTHRLYKFWRTTFSPTGEKPMSFHAMSRNLPEPLPARTRIDEGGDLRNIQDAENETRRRRLTEWQSGTVPKTDQLTEFMESLTGEAYGAFLPFIMTRVATVWTKWIEQEKAQLDQLEKEVPPLTEHWNLAWLLGRFSRYPEYWESAKDQATSEMA